MPLGPGDKALMYALGGVARGGATRGGYISPSAFVKVGGFHRTHGLVSEDFKIRELSIATTRGDTPNRATFEARGWKPVFGDEVIITMGTINSGRRWFGGQVLTATDVFYGQLRGYQCVAVDWSWLLSQGEKVIGRYTGTYDEIALALMEDYAPAGFTTRQVERGLPTVPDGIEFTNVDLYAALGQLAKRGGIVRRVDYSKDLYFRVTKGNLVTNPVTVVPGLSTFRKLNSIQRDISQWFTRVYWEGGGAPLLSAIESGETILPIADASWYDVLGGQFRVLVIRGSYTGVFEGGESAFAGIGAMPSVAPSLDLASGAGCTDGTHFVAVAFKTASGLSLVGPTRSITVGTIALPTIAPTAAVVKGGGPDPGAHYCAMTKVTAAGETPPTPISNVVTTVDGAAAPPAPTVGAGSNIGIGFLTPGHIYTYKIAYADAAGRQTTPSAASGSVTVTASQRVLVTLAYSTDARIASIGLYRSANGGAGPWTRVDISLNNNSGAHYGGLQNYTGGGTVTIDDQGWTATGAGVAAPSSNATGYRSVQLTNLEVPTEPLVINKRIYGTAANGSQLKLIATIAVSATSYLVTMVDASLGANVPTTNTAAANRITVSDLEIGPTPDVTHRYIYMTLAGGLSLKEALIVADNSSESATITASDATLAAAAAAPTTDASGLTQTTGQYLPGRTSIVVTSRAPFRDDGGWVRCGNQLIRYTSIDELTGLFGEYFILLAGIPSSGLGSIQQPIQYGDSVEAVPCLLGVAGIDRDLPVGSQINVLAQVDDADGQAALALLIGGDGVRVPPIQSDGRIALASARAKAQAYLDLHNGPGLSVSYVSKDLNTTIEAEVQFALPPPDSVADALALQTVTVSNFTPSQYPDHTAQASNELYTIEELLAQRR